MKKILILLLIAAFAIIVGLRSSLHKTREERDRYRVNQTALLSDVEHYKTESGKNAASVQKLTLTYDELKKNYDDVVAAAKELNIKVKRMQSVSTTATETRVNVVTQVRDSIIFRDSITQSIKIFRWNDPWVSIFGELNKDSVGIDVQSRDTIVQIVHRIPHKFWFIKWGTKAIRQEIVSKNPHTNIVYTDYIELKK